MRVVDSPALRVRRGMPLAVNKRTGPSEGPSKGPAPRGEGMSMAAGGEGTLVWGSPNGRASPRQGSSLILFPDFQCSRAHRRAEPRRPGGGASQSAHSQPMPSCKGGVHEHRLSPPNPWVAEARALASARREGLRGAAIVAFIGRGVPYATSSDDGPQFGPAAGGLFLPGIGSDDAKEQGRGCPVGG